MYLVTLSTVPVWQLADYLCVSVINRAGKESIVAALITIQLVFDDWLISGVFLKLIHDGGRYFCTAEIKRSETSSLSLWVSSAQAQSGSLLRKTTTRRTRAQMWLRRHAALISGQFAVYSPLLLRAACWSQTGAAAAPPRTDGFAVKSRADTQTNSSRDPENNRWVRVHLFKG